MKFQLKLFFLYPSQTKSLHSSFISYSSLILSLRGQSVFSVSWVADFSNLRLMSCTTCRIQVTVSFLFTSLSVAIFVYFPAHAPSLFIFHTHTLSLFTIHTNTPFLFIFLHTRHLYLFSCPWFIFTYFPKHTPSLSIFLHMCYLFFILLHTRYLCSFSMQTIAT